MIFLGLILLLMSIPTLFVYLSKDIIIKEIKDNHEHARAQVLEQWLNITRWYLPIALATGGITLIIVSNLT